MRQIGTESHYVEMGARKGRSLDVPGERGVCRPVCSEWWLTWRARQDQLGTPYTIVIPIDL